MRYDQLKKIVGKENMVNVTLGSGCLLASFKEGKRNSDYPFSLSIDGTEFI